MKAHHIMTRKVVTVSPDASIRDAAKLMIDYHVSGLPVVNDLGALVGIVTERDFLRRHEVGTQRQRPRWLEFVRGPSLQAIDYVREAGSKVHEIMTRDVHTVTEDAELSDIVELMEKDSIKRVPVMHGGKLVGIVSRQNFVAAIADVTRDTPDVWSSDTLIRRRVITVLRQHDWTPVGLDVRVRDGVVDLDGFITDENVRQAIVVAAENVAGVTRVNDRLRWVDPMSGIYFPADGNLSEKSV